MRVWLTCLSLAWVLLAASCSQQVPPPTQEEIYARDQWAAIVTEQDRHDVYQQSHLHTGWSEKRKVLYELDRFQHIAKSEDRKARWEAEQQRKAASQASTRAASRPTSRATTRHRSTTRTGVSQPSDTMEE